MSNKKYEIVTLDDGTEARRYDDGSLRDSRGWWLQRPPQAADVIDAGNARALVVRKVELAQEAAARGLRDGTRKATDADAIATVAKVQTELAIDKRAGHASTRAAKFVIDLAGYGSGKGDSLPQGVAGRLDVSDAGLRVLAELASRQRDESVPESKQTE
jgi:hypothetical protein